MNDNSKSGNQEESRRFEIILDQMRLEDDRLEIQDICNILKVTPTTIYKDIDKMIEKYYLKNINSKTNGKKIITIDSDHFSLIGLSIGTSLCKLTFLDFSYRRYSCERFLPHKKELYNRILPKVQEDDLLQKCNDESQRNYFFFKTPEDFSVLKDIIDEIFQYIKEKTEEEEIHVMSIGISCTGVINTRTNTIEESHNLSYLEKCSLDTLIFPDKRVFCANNDIHISIIQNSDACAIAEKVYLYLNEPENHNRDFRHTKNIITLYFEYGLGAGIYLDRLYVGSSGYAGEIGHLPSLFAESVKSKIKKRCSCGNINCIENMIRNICFNEVYDKDGSKIDFKDSSASEIRDVLIKDADKSKLLGCYLGEVVNTLTATLNPDVIILTGKIRKCQDILLKEIERERDKSMLRHNRNDCTVLFSYIGSCAPSIGAAIYSYKEKLGLEYRWETVNIH